jgi:hypothetical protein
MAVPAAPEFINSLKLKENKKQAGTCRNDWALLC